MTFFWKSYIDRQALKGFQKNLLKGCDCEQKVRLLFKSYIDSQALYRVFRKFHRMGVRCEQNDDEGESNNVCRKYAREVETTEVDISLK